MSDLLKRLREATEASREIDRAIAEAFGFKVEVFRVPDDHPVLQGGLEFMVGADGSRTGIPPYTASIDAALTLVPQGWGFNISDRAPAPHRGRAYVHNRENHFVGMAATPNPQLKTAEATARTPALALCIACLEARSLTTPPLKEG